MALKRAKNVSNRSEWHCAIQAGHNKEDSYIRVLLRISIQGWTFKLKYNFYSHPKYSFLSPRFCPELLKIIKFCGKESIFYAKNQFDLFKS